MHHFLQKRKKCGSQPGDLCNRKYICIKCQTTKSSTDVIFCLRQILILVNIVNLLNFILLCDCYALLHNNDNQQCRCWLYGNILRAPQQQLDAILNIFLSECQIENTFLAVKRRWKSNDIEQKKKCICELVNE